MRAKSLETVMDAFQIWDNHLTKYTAAGGPEMSEEEKVRVAFRAMPLNSDHSMIRGL